LESSIVASIPRCIELTNPSIGAICYTEIPYNVRVENSKEAQSFSIPQTAQPGFVIVDTQDFQESRVGTTNGPSITITRPGTTLKIQQAYEKAYSDFNNFYQRTEAEVRIKGINFGGMSDIRQKTEEQFKSAINQLTQIQSNSEAIIISGSAQAQWRNWPGITEYTSGGTLRGKIRVYQRYVGTSDQANQIRTSAEYRISPAVESGSDWTQMPGTNAAQVSR
jgi:hypothetical protein